ncbi:MAG TPA: UDP-N-acetylglucosamine--N-acetylmuramyl-(pentapeptide) pyrophosphoryl-undecaprenol N-acetylglucosamine transferase [Candidatus Saccharimonadales bacterium]|jgi:UDP-N-acetylglucosamine--N-acetylmuramyl-(pentapeptide) pyrophosphoryl-undecaprenol N-acetylglucosamine transferase
MRIVVTGGGSGGHITPVLAVARELKRLRPETEVIYIGQKGDKLSDIPAQDSNIDAVYTVQAGKLRRYADEGWRQWLNVRTQSLNLRDAGRLVRGVGQSYRLLRHLKPDVIFTRGGFVSVPVAIGGYLNHIPYITHDSDSVPSLANRLIAPHAALHAVALPADVYPYPRAKTITVGVPVSAEYRPVTPELQRAYRRELGLEHKHMVFLTGGGNGSRILNEALVRNARYLLGTFPDLVIVHVAGRGLEAETNQAYDALNLGQARRRVQVHGFINGLLKYTAAADVVITRSGATTLAELAIQRKASIIVPAPQLVGGHQVKNAQAYARKKAIAELTEAQIEQPERLGRTIGELLDNDERREQLARNLGAYAHPQAATELAELIIRIAGGEGYARTES